MLLNITSSVIFQDDSVAQPQKKNHLIFFISFNTFWKPTKKNNCLCTSSVASFQWQCQRDSWSLGTKQIVLIHFLEKKANCVVLMWLSRQWRRTSGGRNIYSLLFVYIYPHVECFLFTCDAVCSERKPVRQIVQLSTLNRGFLSSLVVMKTLTCFPCSLSHFSLLLTSFS